MRERDICSLQIQVPTAARNEQFGPDETSHVGSILRSSGMLSMSAPLACLSAKSAGAPMTNIPTTPTGFVHGDFRVGHVINRSVSVLSRNFVTFVIVTTIAYLPALFVYRSMAIAATGDPFAMGAPFLGVLLIFLLSLLSQAIVLYGAFQDMRGRPVNLRESLAVAFRRLLPILGMVIVMALALILVAVVGGLLIAGVAMLVGPVVGIIGGIVIMVAAVSLWTMWFVAIPACVVEQRGPVASLGRSSQLTKGHRWKIFGLALLLVLIGAVIGTIFEYVLGAIGGFVAAMIGQLIWNGIWGAFYAIAVVVSYRDLRTAKEGVDIDQIAAVFD